MSCQAETETGGSTEHRLFFSYNRMTGAESGNSNLNIIHIINLYYKLKRKVKTLLVFMFLRFELNKTNIKFL